MASTYGDQVEEEKGLEPWLAGQRGYMVMNDDPPGDLWWMLGDLTFLTTGPVFDPQSRTQVLRADKM